MQSELWLQWGGSFVIPLVGLPRRAVLTCAYLVGMLLMLYIVVIPWTTFKWPNSWTRAQNSAYILFGRPAWALGLAIVSLSCISVAYVPSLSRWWLCFLFPSPAPAANCSPLQFANGRE